MTGVLSALAPVFGLIAVGVNGTQPTVLSVSRMGAGPLRRPASLQPSPSTSLKPTRSMPNPKLS